MQIKLLHFFGIQIVRHQAYNGEAMAHPIWRFHCVLIYCWYNNCLLLVKIIAIGESAASGLNESYMYLCNKLLCI